jgi:SAM-dependent methyltransferase
MPLRAVRLQGRAWFSAPLSRLAIAIAGVASRGQRAIHSPSGEITMPRPAATSLTPAQGLSGAESSITIELADGPLGDRAVIADRGHTGAVPYDPTIYLGSAAHYRDGRPAYSPELEAVLTRETGLDGTGRLLDAGCGPGVLTIRLAHLFDQTVGLDPDAGMLAEGCRAAGEKGVMHIRWVQGLAEDLPAVAPGPYKLVTFGQSFHWTDEQQVAETVYDMLEPGGAMALIVHTVTGRPRPPDPGVPPIPHDEIKALVAKYLRAGGRYSSASAGPRSDQESRSATVWPGLAFRWKAGLTPRL